MTYYTKGLCAEQHVLLQVYTFIAGFHTSGAWVQLVDYGINNTRPIYSERARQALQNP